MKRRDKLAAEEAPLAAEWEMGHDMIALAAAVVDPKLSPDPLLRSIW